MPTTRTHTHGSDPLLESVRAHREAEAREQVAVLTAVLDWASVNVADEAQAAELADPMVEPALHLGGPGCPVIAEYAALDLAALMGMSTDAGLRYLAKTLELRHRLPRLYARVVRLEVPLESLPRRRADHLAPGRRRHPGRPDDQCVPAHLLLGTGRPRRGSRASPVRPRRGRTSSYRGG
jgi:hypothetical protein